MGLKKEYEHFCEQIKEEIIGLFPEDIVEIRDVVKNNGKHVETLMIRRENQNVSPNFYLDEIYERYRRGMSVREIAEQIVSGYERSIRDSEKLQVDFDFVNCREKIVLRLISGERNREILDEVPHIPFLDLAIVFYVVVRQEKDEIGSIRVTNFLQEQWDISTQAMFVLAMENTQRMFPAREAMMLNMMEEQMLEVMEQNEEIREYFERQNDERDELDIPYVITNTCGINGATVILYPDILERLGEKFGANYFLLPSSIHEFIALSSETSIMADRLRFVVGKVNSLCVSHEEQLSENVYYYNIGTGKISIWDNGRSRI